MQIRDLLHSRRSQMLLMADRTRTVLDDVRFMKGVLLMTDFAFAIDRFHGDAIVKTVSQSFASTSEAS